MNELIVVPGVIVTISVLALVLHLRNTEHVIDEQAVSGSWLFCNFLISFFLVVILICALGILTWAVQYGVQFK